MDNQKDIAKKIRREALRKNWRLFRRSKLGMIGLYIVIFFLFLSILQPILFITGVWNKGVYDPVVGYSEQFQEFLVVECPKEYPTEKYDKDQIVLDELKLILGHYSILMLKLANYNTELTTSSTI